MIDTHAHLGTSPFDGDREATLARAFAAGCRHVVEVGIEVASSRRALELARANRRVHAALGIHPHESARHVPGDLDALESLLTDRDVVAVGETGLDFHRDYAPHDAQRALFACHLELALAHDLPLIVHSRGAEEAVVEMLEAMDAGRVGGVLHCYGGPPELVPRIVGAGFHLGFGGAVTRSKGRYRKILPRVPHDRLLLETDCPWLAPAPGTSRRNEPAFIAEVIPVMADLLEMNPARLEAITDENANALFGLDARVEAEAPPDARRDP